MPTDAEIAIDAGVDVIQHKFSQIRSMVSKATYHTCFGVHERRLICKNTIGPCRCVESCNHLSIVEVIFECLAAIDKYHSWPILYHDFDYQLDCYD